MQFIPKQYRLLLIAFLKLTIFGTLFISGLMWFIFDICSRFDCTKFAAVVLTAFFMLMSIAAIGHLSGFDLLHSLKRSNAKLKEAGLRAKDLYDRWLQDVADDVAGHIMFAFVAVVCFIISCAAWASIDPELFSRPASDAEVACLVANVPLKGSFLDYCWSLNPKAEQLTFGRTNRWFDTYMGIFYVYTTFIALSVFLRVWHTYKLIHKLPTYKAEVRRLARYLDHPDE